jgi:hypothetical protein
LEYPLDILKVLVKICDQGWTDRIWEMAVGMQAHEDIVIREKS